MTVLEIRDLTKRFGDVRALDGLSFSLETGEWAALLGPNGAGKTTLMRCVAGLCTPDGGDVDMRTVEGDAFSLGIVPQEIALYPKLSARENLEIFGRINGLSRVELRRQVDWALEWTRLEARADDLVGTFSGGMQRRLNIACGVLHGPELVLLDEPTVGVDPQARALIWEMLAGLQSRGTTLLQSTHQIDEIENITDRAIIMDEGRVVAQGTRDELVQSTFGDASDLSVLLDRDLRGLELTNGFRLSTDRVEGPIANVLDELPDLLARIDRAGARVRSLRVEPPGLAAVFESLTGKELRE